MQPEYIQTMQNLYGELIHILPELEKNLTLWQRANAINEQLEAFYFDENWLALHQHQEGIELDTQGHYSVLSEDALWNAFAEQRSIALKQLKIVADALQEK